MLKVLTLAALTGICALAAPQSQIRFKRDVTSDQFTAIENQDKQLIDNKVNISEANLGGISIHLAAKKGLGITVQLLIHHKSNASAKDKDGNTALHLAALEGHDRVVQILLEHESDVNATNSKGYTPLHLAARGGHDTVAKRLLANGSDVSATNSYGETPLHLAADYGHYEMVKRLIDKGSNESAITSYGDTPFHWAARLGNDELVQLLLDKGSNLSATNNEGNTPMHLAATWGNNQTVEHLIKHGSNVSATNNEGNTPMHLAATWGHDIAVRLLIKHGSNMSATNNDGNTPLHLAASEGHDIVVRLLIDHGSNVSATNNDGNTALHLAASGSHYKVVELFWKKGANFQMKNGNGEEPLPMAKKQYTSLHRYFPEKDKDHENVVNLLEKAVARENKIQNLIKACEFYSMETPDFFINNGNKSELGEFPWMAVLIYLEKHEINNKFKCGGTIISEQYILTAAHCAEDDNQPFRVRLGGVRLDDGNGRNYEIKDIIRHPNYSKAYGKNDIALIKVDEIIFNEHSRPACVETVLCDEMPNVKLNVTGWGSTSSERTDTAKQLHKAEVTTVPLAECNSTYLEYDKEAINTAYKFGIDEGQYCARDPDRNRRSDSCHGDSGGPLQILRNPRAAHVIGIVSAGKACGALPTIHTRVAYYAEWIASHFCFNCMKDIGNITNITKSSNETQF